MRIGIFEDLKELFLFLKNHWNSWRDEWEESSHSSHDAVFTHQNIWFSASFLKCDFSNYLCAPHTTKFCPFVKYGCKLFYYSRKSDNSFASRPKQNSVQWNKRVLWGLRISSAVKSISCSCRRPDLGSQQPHQEGHNDLYGSSERYIALFWPPAALTWHRLTHKQYTCIHITDKDIEKRDLG